MKSKIICVEFGHYDTSTLPYLFADKIRACWVHLINDGITVTEDNVTIEWQGTGRGANVTPPLPFQCKLRHVTSFHDCMCQ